MLTTTGKFILRKDIAFGMKLAYDVIEPPGGVDEHLAAVILLHGRLDSKKTWMNLAPAIAKKTRRKVYAYDARNHGESDWSDAMNFEILTDDLEQFLSDHKIDKAILIGHSLGGRTAITFALRKPEKVEKLIVEDMTTQSYTTIAKQTVQLLLRLLKKSLKVVPAEADELTAKEAIVEFLKSQINPDDVTIKRGVFNLDTLPIRKSGDNYVWQANLDVLEDMLMTEQPALSGAYFGDALFLYGAQSFFDVERDDSIENFFPQAVKVGLKGAGHLIHHDFPDEFLAEVLKFINGPQQK